MIGFPIALAVGLLLPSMSRGEQPLRIDPTQHQPFADQLTSIYSQPKFGVTPMKASSTVTRLTSTGVCPEGQCLSPERTCEGMVYCFVDPCDVTTECSREQCTSNYCGGCYAVCKQEMKGRTMREEIVIIEIFDLDDGDDDDDDDEEILQEPFVIATKHQMFADELTSKLYANDNECSSALGMSMAFSLVYPGSTGDGLEEIRDTFRYPEGSNMHLVWDETTKRMLGNSEGQCLDEYDGECYLAAPLLQIANSVWIDQYDILDSAYEDVVGDYAMQIDFESPDSPHIVNNWVNESTNGLIDSILDESKPLFPPYVLIAINSIYLKAAWAGQFQKSMTNLDSFYGSVAKTTEVSEAHFMNMVEFFDYSHEALPGHKVIDVPFAASQMSMIFVLPTSDSSEAVSSTDLISALNGLQSTRVALSLPKFMFESEYDVMLKESLNNMGIDAPFTEGAGALCGLFEDKQDCEKIIIDKIIQKTIINVNEDGVEAAAVTAVVAGTTSIPTDDPILMILDYPFQFFIHDKLEGLMLFEGRVGAPGVPEGLPEELYGSKHSDSDFWSDAFGVQVVDPAVYVATTSSSAMAISPATQATVASGSFDTTQPSEKASSSDTTRPTEANDSSNMTQPTEAAGYSNTTQPNEVAGSSNTTQPTVGYGSSNASQPTGASGLSTTQPTEAAGSFNTTQPIVGSGSFDTTQPTETDGSSNTTQPTDASSYANTTQPTKASGSSTTTQPTNAAPTDGDNTSSGNTSNKAFSLFSCLCFAFALGFVW